jgi:hypothetical protein
MDISPAVLRFRQCATEFETNVFLLSTHFLSDIAFVLGNYIYHLHTFIITPHSPYLANFLRQNHRPGFHSVIHIAGVAVNDFRRLIW